MIAQIWPKIKTLTTCIIWDFPGPLICSFQIIFSWYSYQWLYVIRPTNVVIYIMIKWKFVELWQFKFGWKCGFSRFFELKPYDNFYADYKFWINNFLCTPVHIPIRYEDIWNFPEVEIFWFELQFDHRFCWFWAILLIFKCNYLDNQKK